MDPALRPGPAAVHPASPGGSPLYGAGFRVHCGQSRRPAPGGGEGAVELRILDDTMTYRNGHIMFTTGATGIAGGPPLGIHPNPNCPSCGKLMFHVVTVEHHIREFGDGWRSGYLCEDCRTVACTGTGWN